MLSILLKVSEDGVANEHSSTVAVVVAFVLSAILFAIIIYVINKFFFLKEAKKVGGIRGYCPFLIDFIMKNYPLAKVVAESSVGMTISAADVYQFVKMNFYLDFNPMNMDVAIKGEIVPDQEKWPSVPPKEFNWLMTKKGDAYADELMVISAIRKDMVFKPEK